MIKQSLLVRFLSVLKRNKITEMRGAVDTYATEIKNDLDIIDFDFRDSKAQIQALLDRVEDDLKRVEDYIMDFKTDLADQISRYHNEYEIVSQEIYQSQWNDTPEYILERTAQNAFVEQEDYFNFFCNRMAHYVDWRFAGMQFRPAGGHITDQIKGLDPLYLVDHHRDLFEEVKKEWHPAYQRRLRYYTVEDTDDNPLEAFPVNQFSCIIAYDFFNYKPMDLIQKYLKACFELLAPGGGIIFTYNDCDQSHGVINVEHKWACYQPKHKMIEMIKELGYEVVFTGDYLANLSWIEAKKPGKLTSIRGGQTVAQIQSLG